MNNYIGIDLGTSSMKAILTDISGKIIKEVSESYKIIYPQKGWTEQNPQDWIVAFKKIIPILIKGYEKTIKGISFGGQMHGLVILDKYDNVIRPCILWNDGRTEKETQYLNEKIGKNALSSLTGNIAFAGFTAPKILWLKDNEPENFSKINKIMLPKDFLIYEICGAFSTDYSDASGTLLLDVKNKKWSKKMCEICGITLEMLPSIHESYEKVGLLSKHYRELFTIDHEVVVAAGASDNAAAAIGTGTVGTGCCNISLGTSGTIFINQDKFSVDSNNSLHSFCHADGNWNLMGCILSAASCRKWWLEDILQTDNYIGNDSSIEKSNQSNVIFLPYLTGERSPYNDVHAKGGFIGLTATTTKEDMSIAVLEGVAFGLKSCVEIAKKSGVKLNKVTICGGGAKSKIWTQIIADVFNKKISIPITEQGPSYGAAILAMVANKEYNSVKDATDRMITIKETISPRKKSVLYYRKKYGIYKKLYPTLKKIFYKMDENDR